jgi:hypothetical protein
LKGSVTGVTLKGAALNEKYFDYNAHTTLHKKKKN